MIREDEEEMMLPAWLQGLMTETFFVACETHCNHRKIEKNIYCLHCCQSFCTHCIPIHHPQHSLLQVRRYLYQSVIRLGDLEKIIDSSFIQSYTINRAKVIFLNPRGQTQPRSNCKTHFGGGGGGGGDANSRNACFTCDRILQEPFNFCSLSCKVAHYMYRREDLSSLLCNELDFGFQGLQVEEEETPPSSILEDPFQCEGSNYGTGSRRKGAPQRSPLS